MRSAAGQQWSMQKSKDKELSTAYAAVGRSYSAQRAFRQKWAVDRYEDEKEKREKMEVHRMDYGKYGRYKPFSVIVRDEGGDEQARQAALQIVRSELVLQREGKLLGGFAPWFMVNPLSKRTEWMHLETRFSDMFSQAWSTAVVQDKAVQDVPDMVAETPQKTAGRGAKRQAANMVTDGEGAATPKPDGEGRKNGKTPKTSPMKQEPEEESAKTARLAEKKEQQKQMTELKMLKTKLLTTSAAGKAVLDTIRTNSAWEYFNNGSSTKPLTTAPRLH